MRTLGVDLSANPRKTAVAVLEWRPDRAELVELLLGVLDEDIVSLIAGCDYTGIDCPLGRPTGRRTVSSPACCGWCRSASRPTGWPTCP
jgi:predicted nuclease with RNAse H fold